MSLSVIPRVSFCPSISLLCLHPYLPGSHPEPSLSFVCVCVCVSARASTHASAGSRASPRYTGQVFECALSVISQRPTLRPPVGCLSSQSPLPTPVIPSPLPHLRGGVTYKPQAESEYQMSLTSWMSLGWLHVCLLPPLSRDLTEQLPMSHCGV